MIKKLFLLTGLFLTSLVSMSQVNMTLQVPPVGVLLKSQLWNILLVSGNNSNQLVTVNLALQDAQTSQVVMSAYSRPVNISKGATQLKVDVLSPIQYNYNSSIFNNDRDPNGMLPAGVYIACYTIIGDHNATLTENCINLTVEPLSPPLLNTPANEAVLQTSYPQFTWLPPTPLNIFSDLNYDFSIVEVLPGQSSTEAIQNNVPVYNAGRLKELFYNYPASNKQLDTGRLYAWHITARNNGQVAGQSETWVFKIVKNIPVVQKMEQPYYKMKNGLEAGMAVCYGTLKFQYENLTPVRSVNYTITSIENNRKTIIKQGALPLVTGQNFLQIDLQKGSVFSENQTYLLEITDERKQVWNLKFNYIKPTGNQP